MIHCIEIAEDPQCAEESPADKGREIFFLKGKSVFGTEQDDQREEERYQIPEKAFLDRRQIARHANEHVHQGEKKRRTDDIENSLLFFVDG